MGAFPEQRMSLITLGVDDREAATAFYRDVLGFTPFMTDGITVFDMGGMALGLWEKNKLRQDIGLMGNTPGCHPSAALAYNARSKAEVDEIFARLREADVDITTEPHDAFWGGYSGYFVDPDGHAWEVAYNPFWTIREDGSLVFEKAEEGA